MGEEESSSSVAPRKMKFTPKIPPRKTSKPPMPKAEQSESNEGDVTDRALLRRVKQAAQGPARRSPMERKAAAMEVALGHMGPRTSALSFGVPRNKTNEGGPDMLAAKKKDYVEPWNYYSNYPVVLPLRRPYSGNPEVLDEEEFGETSAVSEYDESRINCAEELGLKDDITNGRMLFLQLPASLPLGRSSGSSAEGKEIKGKGVGMSQEGHSLDDRSAVLKGKMLVYKSGAVKMKLGDTVFDVSPGSECVFAQDVMAINTKNRHCCVLGELKKRMVVRPDVDYLLSSLTK